MKSNPMVIRNLQGGTNAESLCGFVRAVAGNQQDLLDHWKALFLQNKMQVALTIDLYAEKEN